MNILSWIVTVLVVALVAGFVVYLVSLRKLHVAERVEVTVYDRFGRPTKKAQAAPPLRH